jgi:hypothetical protein
MADRVEYCFPRHPANHADFDLAEACEVAPEGILRCGHALRSAGKRYHSLLMTPFSFFVKVSVISQS